jgi:hypothetical protein
MRADERYQVGSRVSHRPAPSPPTTTADQAQQLRRQADGRSEGPRRTEDREGEDRRRRKVADADLGPLRYLATLLGAGDQDVLRPFILVVTTLLDPAAALPPAGR